MSSIITAFLHRVWLDMCDEANAEGMRYATGVIDGLREAGAITTDDHELWEGRFQRCPGHEGSRVWCAYCGDLPTLSDEEIDSAFECQKCGRGPMSSPGLCDDCGAE